MPVVNLENEKAVRACSPARWIRFIVYTLAWLPVFIEMILFVPTFEPVFTKMPADAPLPVATSGLMSIVRMDRDLFHLPFFFVIVALFAIDDRVVHLLSTRLRRTIWSWLWVIFVALAGLGAQLVLVVLLLLPAFR